LADSHNPLIKFSYTLLNPDGVPYQKSWIVNLAYVVTIEASGSNDLKLYLRNDQVVSIELGEEQGAEEVMEEILSLSAVGHNYSVYRINTFRK
jgi:N-acetyl-beta-hexosaminidase